MYVCMYIFMNINCRWFYEKCKKKIWENVELKVKKYVSVYADLSLIMNI